MITSVSGEEAVFTVILPKVKEVGFAFICARAASGRSAEATKDKVSDKHTNSVLCMGGTSFVRFCGAEQNWRRGEPGRCSRNLSTLRIIRKRASLDYWQEG